MAGHRRREDKRLRKGERWRKDVGAPRLRGEDRRKQQGDTTQKVEAGVEVS